MHASEFVRDEPLQHDVVKNTRARLRINERPSSSEIMYGQNTCPQRVYSDLKGTVHSSLFGQHQVVWTSSHEGALVICPQVIKRLGAWAHLGLIIIMTLWQITTMYVLPMVTMTPTQVHKCYSPKVTASSISDANISTLAEFDFNHRISVPRI